MSWKIHFRCSTEKNCYELQLGDPKGNKSAISETSLHSEDHVWSPIATLIYKVKQLIVDGVAEVEDITIKEFKIEPGHTPKDRASFECQLEFKIQGVVEPQGFHTCHKPGRCSEPIVVVHCFQAALDRIAADTRASHGRSFSLVAGA